jgi:hypothetical protein
MADEPMMVTRRGTRGYSGRVHGAGGKIRMAD